LRLKPKSFETVKKFEYNGYKCIVARNNSFNALLGYVLLPKGHKYFGMPIKDIPVECHGNLTYGKIEGDYYVIGFDCAHAFDFDVRPDIAELNLKNIFGKPNKNEDFATQEIKSIVEQL